MKANLTLIFFVLMLASCSTAVNDQSTEVAADGQASTDTSSAVPDSAAFLSDGRSDEEVEKSSDEAMAEVEKENSGPPPYPGAQRKWSYTFHGFTQDLSTTAFESSGNDDYNWVGYEFFVVNVNKNDFAAKAYRERFEDEVPDSVINVIKKRVTGYKLPTKGYTTFSFDGAKPEANVAIKGKNYRLKLLQTIVGENAIFELQLIDPSTSKIWILQKDKKLPASRGSVKRYRLKDAYVQNSKIAVMLEMDMESWQFEGLWEYPTKYMMVTGSIE